MRLEELDWESKCVDQHDKREVHVETRQKIYRVSDFPCFHELHQISIFFFTLRWMSCAHHGLAVDQADKREISSGMKRPAGFEIARLL